MERLNSGSVDHRALRELPLPYRDEEGMLKAAEGVEPYGTLRRYSIQEFALVITIEKAMHMQSFAIHVLDANGRPSTRLDGAALIAADGRRSPPFWQARSWVDKGFLDSTFRLVDAMGRVLTLQAVE